MWKSIGKMAATTFLAAFLNDLGSRAVRYLWPDVEGKEEETEEEEEVIEEKTKTKITTTTCPPLRLCTRCNRSEPILEDLDWCFACVETYDGDDPNAGMSKAWLAKNST